MEEYHVLWLQTIPSIASIYYYRHLIDTHDLYCLDRGEQQQTIRSLGRSLYNEITKSKKKLAVYCSTFCSEKKYHSIINFLLKSQEDLNIKCLSLPTTFFQWHILNAWTHNLEQNSLWKELCDIPFEPGTFLPNMETVNEFMSPFTIADQPFFKKALIVHMTPELFDFSLKQGFQLKKFVLHTMQGWRKATEGWSLVWILDENEIFGKKVVGGLDNYRNKLRNSIQSYATDIIPIYTFTVNYDCKPSGDLSHQLAWIQHRHHFCVGESFLLKWAETPLSPSSYFDSLHCIYLNSEAKVDDMKWRDNFLSMINHKARNQDTLDYIRSTALCLPMDLNNFLTPLLPSYMKEEEKETILLKTSTHQVAYNPKTVNDWIQTIQQNKPVLKWPIKIYEMATPELLDADIDTKEVLRQKEHIRATYKTIENESFFIHSKVEQHEIEIKGNEDKDGVFKMIDGYCTCKQTYCSHIMATLCVFADMPIIFGVLSDTQTTVDLGSQKRGVETDESESSKRQRHSQESNSDDDAGFIPYDEPTQLVVNLTHLSSLDETQDDESTNHGTSQEPQLSLGGDDSSFTQDTKDQSLSFPTLSSVGSIRYKDSLSNPLAYSPAKINLQHVVSEANITKTVAPTTQRDGAANLTWQADTATQQDTTHQY